MLKFAARVLCFLVIFKPAYAQDPSETSARVQEINQIVEKHTIELQERQEKQKKIEQDYSRIKQEVRGVQQKQAQLKKDFDNAKSQVDNLNKEIELAADHIESLERKYAARIRVLYMHRSQDFLENVFLTSDQTTLKRNAYFMTRIKDSDQKIMNDLFLLKSDRESKIQALNKTLKEKEELNEKVAKQTKVLNSKLAEQESTLKEFNREKSNLEQTIASLKAQSLRIETVITSITGKDSAEASRQQGKNSLKQSLSSAKLEAYNGEGLEGSRGKVPIPVKGDIIKDSPAKDADTVQIGKILGAKGILFSVAPGSDVSAVENGKVIFNSTMPGRGKMLIIDHGQRSYSLYGKLSESNVNLQQEVSKGEIIGKTELKAEGQAEFYFEIRKNGIAVNTKSYLKIP